MGVLDLMFDTVTTMFTGGFTLVALVLAAISWPALTSTTKIATIWAFVAMMYDGVLTGDDYDFTVGDVAITGGITFGAMAVMK